MFSMFFQSKERLALAAPLLRQTSINQGNGGVPPEAAPLSGEPNAVAPGARQYELIKPYLSRNQHQNIPLHEGSHRSRRTLEMVEYGGTSHDHAAQGDDLRDLHVATLNCINVLLRY